MAGDTSGVLQLATNGSTTALTIDTSQNVGIGTSSPNAKLDVPSQILAGGTGNNAYAINSSGSNYGFISNPSTGVFGLAYGTTIGTLGTSVATWNSSGNFAFNSGYGSVATAYGCRAWVNFNGSGTPAIRASGNVSSITDNGTGYYTVNFTNALPDANYTAVVGAASTSNTTNAWVFTSPTQALVTPTTSAFTVLTNNLTNTAQIDATYITVAVFR
jgi:hypothetical protein